MSVSCERLLYPELLSNEELIHIIQERHLRMENIERFSRHELIELFRNFCIPHGQRKYRDSGRGKVLNKSRLSPQKVPEITRNNENNHKLEGLSVTNNGLSRKVPYSDCDRLKTPLDVFSGSIKRIKLDHVWKDVDCSKRKIPLDSMSPTIDCTPPKRERKLITWP